MQPIVPTLYLIPNTVAEESPDVVFPKYNRQIIHQLKYFIAEDAKSCRRLLKTLDYPDIAGAVIEEYSEHDIEKDPYEYLNPLLGGNSVGLISDAGCPAVADPGEQIVFAAHQKKINIQALIGPSSILLSVMQSGLSGNSFAFNGYLPIESSDKIKKIKELEILSYNKKQSQFFIETPYRNEKLFSLLLNTLHPATALSVNCNLLAQHTISKTYYVSDWKKQKMPDIQKKPCVFGLMKAK